MNTDLMLRARRCAGVLAAFCGATLVSAPPVTPPVQAPPVVNTAPEEPVIDEPLQRKMSDIAQRIIPEVDAGTFAEKPEIKPPAVASPTSPSAKKPVDMQPLYLRRHGISAGTRVEWVAPPAEKVAKAAKAGKAKDTTPSANSSLQPLLEAAAAGNTRAMTVLGLLYHKGEGIPQDLIAAHDWYLKAASQGDGDAINNLGALYRDGFSGHKDRKIAYLVFLAAYRSGEGNEQTRTRARGNLQGLLDEISKPEIYEALSYTWPYVRRVLDSHGTNWEITPEVLPTKDRPRIRDNNWWQESEKLAMTFASPPPWDKLDN